MFVTVLPSNFTGVVKFTASWCGPCQRIAEALKSTCAQHGVTLLEVDVDSESELPGQFQVNAMPTLVLLLEGKEIQNLPRVVGANMAQISAAVEQLKTLIPPSNQISLPVDTAASVACHPQASSQS